jgi:hypothetical protein
MWGRGIKDVQKDEGILESWVGYGKLSLESDGRNGERCMYLACDFNGRWLKDSSLLHCIVIVLSVKNRVGYVMKVIYCLELVSLHFSRTKSKGVDIG